MPTGHIGSGWRGLLLAQVLHQPVSVGRAQPGEPAVVKKPVSQRYNAYHLNIGRHEVPSEANQNLYGSAIRELFFQEQAHAPGRQIMSNTTPCRLVRRGAGSNQTAHDRDLDAHPAVQPTARPDISASGAFQRETVCFPANPPPPLRLPERWLRGWRPTSVASRAAFGTGVGRHSGLIWSRSVLCSSHGHSLLSAERRFTIYS